MKTVLMHNYVDVHEHVTGKGFGGEIKNKISELHFTKFPFLNTVDCLHKYHINCLLAMF